ncbi:sce7725 family protein [Qipengyuania sp. CAU 1752]
MYYPYFRGKQYELIVIRETAQLMADRGFVPIISPVREQVRGLQKALTSLCHNGTIAVVIVNPEHGDHKDDGSAISDLLRDEFAEHDNLLVGIRLHEELSAEEALAYCEAADGRPIALIHAGFTEANAFQEGSGAYPNIARSIFLEDQCGKLYQRKFRTHQERVLVRDGFERRRNRDHPSTEFFSDLHITYVEEGMTGFGDFLIVGDDYQEGGGPAYTIAIHLTYIDPNQDDAMFVRHFLSDRQDTPKDPGGKFAEALAKLIQAIDAPDSKFVETSAIREFRDLHARGHYPGLGTAKKLSMAHHIETLAQFFDSNGDQ